MNEKINFTPEDIAASIMLEFYKSDIERLQDLTNQIKSYIEAWKTTTNPVARELVEILKRWYDEYAQEANEVYDVYKDIKNEIKNGKLPKDLLNKFFRNLGDVLTSISELEEKVVMCFLKITAA